MTGDARDDSELKICSGSSPEQILKGLSLDFGFSNVIALPGFRPRPGADIKKCVASEAAALISKHTFNYF